MDLGSAGGGAGAGWGGAQHGLSELSAPRGLGL